MMNVSQISTIKFSVNAGSRSELVNEKGAAHLLSYCAFEGTQQRSGLRLVREMENHAFVMKNKTCRERVSDDQEPSLSCHSHITLFSIERILPSSCPRVCLGSYFISRRSSVLPPQALLHCTSSPPVSHLFFCVAFS